MISIYEIYCSGNDKYYIGSTKNIKSRWKCHKNNLKNNKHVNVYLQNAWNKYGEHSFRFSIVEHTQENRVICEQKVLDKYIKLYGNDKIFNIAKIIDAPFSGLLHSEEFKERMSYKMSGENAPKAKINWSIVKEIRTNYLVNMITREKLAEIYGIANSNITEIINNTHWYDPEYTPPSKETIKKNRYLNHSKSHKGKVAGDKNPHAKLNWDIVRQMRKDYKEGKIKQKDLVKKYCVTSTCISNILNNKRWIE